MKLPAWLASWKSTLAALLSAFFTIGPSVWPEWFLGHAHQVQLAGAIATALGLLMHTDTSVVLKDLVERSNLNAAPDHPASLETAIKQAVGGVAKDAIDKKLRLTR